MIWERASLARAWGTPFPTMVEEMAVVVIARGAIVRVSDGEVVGSGAGKVEYCSPLVVDEIAYLIENGGQATRLAPGSAGVATTQAEWVYAADSRASTRHLPAHLGR